MRFARIGNIGGDLVEPVLRLSLSLLERSFLSSCDDGERKKSCGREAHDCDSEGGMWRNVDRRVEFKT